MNKKGFTLIEMLIVIGIIAILIGATITGLSKMTATAEKARCRELVSNVATALTVYFQQEGAWPRALRENNGGSDGKLDATTAYAFVAGNRKYLTLTKNQNKLAGNDRFGIVTPWATAVIKKRGTHATLTTPVPSGGTIDDHILHFAIDLDGDGIIPNARIGGQNLAIRATAAVWCCGRDGKIEAYSTGRRRDDVHSWSHGQTQHVQ